MLRPPSRNHVVFLGGPELEYEEFRPPPELAPWVAVSWRIRARADGDLRILPDGCMDLIRGDVVGSFTGATTVRFSAGDVTEGIRFHPADSRRSSALPASELTGLRVPIDDVLPRFRSLRALAADAERPDPLAGAAYAARDVRELARDSGYSERQLRRRVAESTGHGPKRLMRIARMQRLLRDGRGESWARTAAEHGYFDEAHMAGDVRELAGATPHALLG